MNLGIFHQFSMLQPQSFVPQRDSTIEMEEIEIPPPRREKPPPPERKSSVRDEPILRGEGFYKM